MQPASPRPLSVESIANTTRLSQCASRLFLIFVLFFSTSRIAWCLQDAEAPLEDKTAPKIELIQPGVRLTLLAEHPQLATPTGIDVDAEGRIYLIACHTHFPPDGYAGPRKDQILVFDRDGQNQQVFYDQTKTTMQLLLGKDGWVYLAQRDRILRVKDTNGDGVGDVEQTIATLDTLADYPHNGLSGMAWHNDGGLLFSLGENFGKDWTLRGTDNRKLTGKGEGGVFHVTRDGHGLRRVARGFWNPFGLMMRSDGIMFAAENDPGSRPPCRLLHVVERADYGFQYIYGSAPVHPFVAWNGELRGTLGMIHSCSEGPCSVVELGGGVLVPSWSNHCIDFFPLHWKGATLTSERIELLRGSDYFRPVCLARGPDQAFYMTDWVSPSYQVHGMGRLWKLEIDREQAPWLQIEREPPTTEAKLAEELRQGRLKKTLAELLQLAKSKDRTLADAALTAMAIQSSSWNTETLRALSSEDRVWALVALRRTNLKDPKWLKFLWADKTPELRFECLRWIADGELKEFSPQVEMLLNEPNLDYRLFEAALAAINTLKGKPEAGVTDQASLIDRVLSPSTPSAARAYLLRMVSPNHDKLTIPLLLQCYQSQNPLLQLEAVRTLVMKRRPEAQNALLQIVNDPSASDDLRAEALIGFIGTDDPVQREAIVTQLPNASPKVLKESLRALRHPIAKLDDEEPLKLAVASHPEFALMMEAIKDPLSLTDRSPETMTTDVVMERLKSLPGQADPEAGRRVFFSSGTAACSQCHRYDGRGIVVGPDLSFVHEQGSYREILDSILEPNRNVAPQFYSTYLDLEDGSTFTGILLRSSSNEVYRDNHGEEVTFQKADIVSRKELRSSLMPTGLAHQMTDLELRDLMAFLTKP